MKYDQKFLYLVVLGGRAAKANIELHDVRWVVGSTIDDTFEELRNQWFGLMNGLHIDSYKRINSVDGYKVILRKKGFKDSNNSTIKKNKNLKQKLWFINIGGYETNSMQEKHEFGLVVATSASEAKSKAKSRWLIGTKQKHKDDLAFLKNLDDIDNCKVIKKVNQWEIELVPEKYYLEEKNVPDWFGYMRIDET